MPPSDMRPDRIVFLQPLIDDAIYVEFVIRELRNETESYEKFSKYRVAEEARRKESGLNPHVERATLHARMRKRRTDRSDTQSWHLNFCIDVRR